MSLSRPDLAPVSDEVRAYIEYLEEALEKATSSGSQSRTSARGSSARDNTSGEPTEQPSSAVILTATRRGRIKRTPRHLYGRQRRGGMGIFDLDTSEDDPPALLSSGDEADRLLLITSRSRLFFVRMADLPDAPIRDDGTLLTPNLPLQPNEEIVALLPETSNPFFNLVSDRGWVRRFSGSQLSRLSSGAVLEIRQGHRPVSACWSDGTQDLVIATKGGQGIRFDEKRVPFQGGCLGIRLDSSDEALAITSVNEDDGIFLLSSEGKGTVRLVSGFRANKSPGAGGKVLMKTDALVGAAQVKSGEDVFTISQLSKIIRFSMDDVPPKTGVVQGVNCMNLRSDQAVAITVTAPGIPISDGD